jgi:hypothetical protein
MDPKTGNALTEDGAYLKDPKRGVPVELWRKIIEWADEQGYSRKDGNYKKANKPFHEMILSLPEKRREAIVEETAEWAEHYIRAFHGESTVEAVMEAVAKRKDHNAAPERSIRGPRIDFVPEKAPRCKSRASGGDFSE